MNPLEPLTPFQILLSRHVGSAFSRQLAFAEIVGELDWSADLDQGTINFGGRLTFPVQLLGSQSDRDGSWLWSWANEAGDFPPAIMQAALQMKELGAREGIEELTEPHFESDLAYGDTISLIATGLNPGSCYYRGPYDGGAAFMLVVNAPAVVTQPADSARILSVISEVVATWDVDHALMAEEFLKQQGFRWERIGNQASATRQGEQIQVSFDDFGRLESLEGNFEPVNPSSL